MQQLSSKGMQYLDNIRNYNLRTRSNAPGKAAATNSLPTWEAVQADAEQDSRSLSAPFESKPLVINAPSNHQNSDSKHREASKIFKIRGI